ncbi:hypothetical protein [Nostoc sp.]|uniref:hypothetical protein n=1 Tax=Nostoc sp. TaxID=1180 RepID=UPI002FFBDE05
MSNIITNIERATPSIYQPSPLYWLRSHSFIIRLFVTITGLPSSLMKVFGRS